MIHPPETTVCPICGENALILTVEKTTERAVQRLFSFGGRVVQMTVREWPKLTCRMCGASAWGF